MLTGRHWRLARLLLFTLLVTACANHKPVTIPMVTYPYLTSTPKSAGLIVLLPGIHDDASLFEKAGFIADAQQIAPEFDLVAVDAHYGYYDQRILVERLRQDVILPARQRGYRRIILVGISLGGYGALSYAKKHLDEISAIILLGPYLGSQPLIEEIINTGGLSTWEPSAISGSADEAAIWQWLKATARPGAETSKLYLAYGDSDRFIQAQRMLAETLPDTQVMSVPGGHNWKTWRVLWRQMLTSSVFDRLQSQHGWPSVVFGRINSALQENSGLFVGSNLFDQLC